MGQRTVSILEPNRARHCYQRIAFVAALLFVTILRTHPAVADLHQYDSKYYVIHTDIDPDDAREAIVRMTKMAEEYHERTKSFAGTIRTQFPFFLYRSAEDYHANGGPPGTAGLFVVDEKGARLLAIAGQKTTLNTWHTVQHEGFHQFAHAVIGGHIPTWLNEGLAEYFGESIFTGDGFVTGIIPPWRLARLKREFDDDQLKSVHDIMETSSEKWLMEMNIRNYDQAWSMVHFLVNAENGKYQPAFSDCIRGISQGRNFDRAWLSSMGPAAGFEDQWKQYWQSQPESPTSELYARAAVATLTSFLARATAQQQTFADFDVFRTAAEADTLKIHQDDWLPHSLLTDTLREVESDQHITLHPGINKLPVITIPLPDGKLITGWFTLRGPRVDQVNVEVDDLPKVLKAAQNAPNNGGKKGDIRLMVQASLKQHPTSPAAAEAKKFLQSLR
jgi:hypothetical protein